MPKNTATSRNLSNSIRFSTWLNLYLRFIKFWFSTEFSIWFSPSRSPARPWRTWSSRSARRRARPERPWTCTGSPRGESGTAPCTCSPGSRTGWHRGAPGLRIFVARRCFKEGRRGTYENEKWKTPNYYDERQKTSPFCPMLLLIWTNYDSKGSGINFQLSVCLRKHVFSMFSLHFSDFSAIKNCQS